MTSQIIILIIVSIYLIFTTLLGLVQSKTVKSSNDFVVTEISPFLAATYLSGFTLGGVSTYGVAGDTIKFGFTYLVWFPISMGLGWWLTGLLFARPYFQNKGITLPALIGKRFSERTRIASLVSLLIYSIFVIVVELYTLVTIIKAISPQLSMMTAVLISFIVCIGTVAFSGILGASVTNLVHSVTMIVAFGLAYIAMNNIVGGWENAIQTIPNFLPQISGRNVDPAMWLSPIGMGWGVIGQIILAKTTRLGGISTVSNLAASCHSERDAKLAFWLAGIFSAIPPFLACSVGIFTAAYLGPRISETPIYSAIGQALNEVNPVIAGIFLSAVLAAVISTFSPLAISFAHIFVEDLVCKAVPISEKLKRLIYPFFIVATTGICAWYVLAFGIENIMPFVFSTAFPCTIPNTIVLLFGLHFENTSDLAAFFSIAIGVIVSLGWGLILNDPFNIPNIYLAFLIPLIIMSLDQLVLKFYPRSKVQELEAD
mgnify:CR=1 FL=1